MRLKDNSFSDFLQEFIDKRIELKLAKLQFDRSYHGKVVAVNGGLIDVKLAGDSNTIITGLKNKSGETLIINDEVIMTAINNNLNNLVITIKK